jgi:membrane protease YdiL (CAAX protease family)
MVFVLIFLVQLCAVLGFIAYFIRLSGRIRPGGVPWTGLEAVTVTVLDYILALYAFGPLLAVGLAHIVHSNAPLDWLDNSVAGQFVGTLALEAVALGLLLLFLRRRKSTLQAIGLKGWPRLKDAAYAVAGFFVYMLLYLPIASMASKVINTDQKQQVGFNGAHGPALITVFISLVILPPIVEEITMRGFLYSGLKNQFNLFWAAIITSLVFATAHLQFGSDAPLLWVAALDTFILSLVLVRLREKTGRLWASMGLHALKNTVAFLTLFVWHLPK